MCYDKNNQFLYEMRETHAVIDRTGFTGTADFADKLSAHAAGCHL
jgi:hypothetical protein